ncbi:hypothetical protein [Brevundimonas sp. SGAir0440]|uniref:hypothetical protein n=1 Tax=Brevundimonas sp. SGAir0440 TaxID=2579977 RepID=UPI0010CD6163|nr:hypothetical protein [Brevundimonas sp. SGAir0440]QCQ97749.1 hypothetical protein E7T10_03225 [Brevundimonas sp. SGAir0440]
MNEETLMLVEAHSPTRCVSVAADAPKPCRFCGEARQIDIDPGALDVLWAIDADGAVIRDESGQPIDAPAEDIAICKSCDAVAPLKIWNASPEWMAARAASIVAADAEYDDDGVWIGVRQ